MSHNLEFRSFLAQRIHDKNTTMWEFSKLNGQVVRVRVISRLLFR